jgi:hypothetical protein
MPYGYFLLVQPYRLGNTGQESSSKNSVHTSLFKLSFLTSRLVKEKDILFCFDYSAPSVIARAACVCGMKQ